MTQTTTSSILDRVRANFNFEVIKQPLSFPDNMPTSMFGLARTDDFSEVVNRSVTAQYMPHTVDDVCALVEGTQEAFTGCDVQCWFNRGHYVTITPPASHRKAVFGTADNVWPRVTIAAGYDGKAFKAIMGYYRDACDNLAMMQTVKDCVVKISHNGKLRDRMDELIERFQGLQSGWDSLQNVIDEMENEQVELTAFLNRVYGEPTEAKRSITIHENRTKAIFKALRRERTRVGKNPTCELDGSWNVSVWEAYNAVQGFAQHKATRHGEPTDYAKIILAANDPSVKKAESIALDLVA